MTEGDKPTPDKQNVFVSVSAGKLKSVCVIMNYKGMFLRDSQVSFFKNSYISFRIPQIVLQNIDRRRETDVDFSPPYEDANSTGELPSLFTDSLKLPATSRASSNAWICMSNEIIFLIVILERNTQNIQINNNTHSKLHSCITK